MRGLKHSASHWTACERPAWRSLSPATATNTAAILKKKKKKLKQLNKEYLAALANVYVFSPHGWVSSLAAESHNKTWQLPEETSPSIPLGDPAHEVWWCPLCCLREGKNRHNLLEQAQNNTNYRLNHSKNNKSVCISVIQPSCSDHVVLPPACSISLMQNLAVVTAAGWWAGALSVNRKSLPRRMAQTPCCAALRTWEEKVDIK